MTDMETGVVEDIPDQEGKPDTSDDIVESSVDHPEVQHDGSQNDTPKNNNDIDSPFEVFNTVYV